MRRLATSAIILTVGEFRVHGGDHDLLKECARVFSPVRDRLFFIAVRRHEILRLVRRPSLLLISVDIRKDATYLCAPEVLDLPPNLDSFDEREEFSGSERPKCLVGQSEIVTSDREEL